MRYRNHLRRQDWNSNRKLHLLRLLNQFVWKKKHLIQPAATIRGAFYGALKNGFRADCSGFVTDWLDIFRRKYILLAELRLLNPTKENVFIHVAYSTGQFGAASEQNSWVLQPIIGASPAWKSLEVIAEPDKSGPVENVQSRQQAAGIVHTEDVNWGWSLPARRHRRRWSGRRLLISVFLLVSLFLH